MATATDTGSQNSVAKLVSRYFAADNIAEREVISTQAVIYLSEEEQKIFTMTIKNAPALKDTPKGSEAGPSGQQDKGKEREAGPVVSDDDLINMWTVIDKIDLLNLISDDLIKDFQYAGFNPDAILRSLLKKKKENDVSDDQFKADLASMVLIAIMKGSITDDNLIKMSDGGKRRYGELEKRYDIKRGGAKGKAGDIVTISRIAATFPGMVIRIISGHKETARSFSGSFKTDKLPAFLRHQAISACIPKSLDESAKDFILGLIVAFSVDQTKAISKTKESYLDLFGKQKSFTLVSHNGAYPPENVRKEIFKTLPWIDSYARMKEVSDVVKKIVTDFDQISLDEFSAAVNTIK